MGELVVNKSIEKRGMIGPLYVHEALVLALVTMVSFFGLIVLNVIFKISKLWILSCPALFFMVLLSLRFFRKNSNPTYLFSWLAFYCKQPRYMNTNRGTLWHKLKKTKTALKIWSLFMSSEMS